MFLRPPLKRSLKTNTVKMPNSEVYVSSNSLEKSVMLQPMAITTANIRDEDCRCSNKDVLKLDPPTIVTESCQSCDTARRKCHSPMSRRYVVVFLIFLACVASNSLRVIINVAIVSMVGLHGRASKRTNSTMAEKKTADFDWDGKTQGLVLGSYFYGYLVLQIPAGYFASRFGGHISITVGLLGSVLMTLLNPIGAKLSPLFLAAIRVFLGLFSCFIIPSVYTLLSKWSPPHERSKMATFALAGVTGGIVVGNIASGVLCDSFGWESAFYVQGGVGFVLTILYFIFVSETPTTDRWISIQERSYIQKCFDDLPGTEVKKVTKVPWRELLTSVPVIALTIDHVCFNWGFYTLLIEIPSFLSKVYDYDVQESGIISSAPYLLFMVIGVTGGVLSDRLRRNCLSTTATRKLMNGVGFGMQTIFLLLVSFINDRKVAVVSFIASVGSGGLAMSCVPVNQLDIAPRYSALLMGITNTLATIPGAISPVIVGVLTEKNTHEEWRNVFLITISFYGFALVVYTLFGSGEKQPWADHGLEEREEDKTEIDGILA